MAYCTRENLKLDTDLLRQLIPQRDEEDKIVYDAAGKPVIDEEKITAAIGDAEKVINGYLIAGGYNTPRDPVDNLIFGFAVKIGRYNVYMHGTGIPETEQTNYNNTLKTLKDIASGELKLEENKPASNAGFMCQTFEEPVFTMELFE